MDADELRHEKELRMQAEEELLRLRMAVRRGWTSPPDTNDFRRLTEQSELRILVETVSPEGAAFHDALNWAGFPVLPFYRARSCADGLGTGSAGRQTASSGLPLRIEFPSNSPLWGRLVPTSEAGKPRPSNAEVLRALERFLPFDHPG